MTVIVKAFQLGEQGGKSFSDTETHWAKSAITIVAAADIVAGYRDSSFEPDDFITREQMAATDKSANFPDSSDISDCARTALATATAQGMIKGYEDGTVKPKVNTTRAKRSRSFSELYNRQSSGSNAGAAAAERQTDRRKNFK